VIITIAAVALFAESLHLLGLEQIVAGVARIGWGFTGILILSGARDVVRALAWTRAVSGPERLPFLEALRARLAGEALNTLLPMGVLVGEPVKASHVSDRIGFASAGRALALEFAFYTGSLALLFAAGLAALGAVSGYGLGVPAAIAGVAAAAIVTALIVRRSPVLSHTRPEHLTTIVGCEVAYQLLSVAELYYTLLLISPVRPTFASALLLETVSRAVTMVFKMVPMRIGVDEATSSFVAGRLDLNPATGLAVALVRKLRLLFWSAVGLVFLARRPARAAVPTAARASLVLPALTLLALLLTPGALAAQTQDAAVVAGSVSITSPDGSPLLVPGVTVTLACGGREARTEISDDQGEFRFTGVAASTDCSMVADLQGFKSVATTVAPKAGETAVVALLLGLDTLREEVTVHANAEIVDAGMKGARVERITSSVMQTAPIAADRFQDALPLIPGVVRGPDGLLNISGTRSNQSALTFNNANGTDPVTGEDAIELPIDAVSSVQVRGAAYAPEFGLSAGAVTTVETQKAGDDWDVTVNDLEPRLRRRAGEFRGIESWTPRVTLGGPIVKGKLNLLESMQYEYSQTRVFGLPPFESDTKLQSFESFTRADLMLSATNRLTGSAMISPRKTTYAGLNTFNPQGVTADIKNHNVLASAADQIVVGGKGLLETRLSVKEFDSTIYPTQGNGPMILAPDVNSGSYFNNQDRTSRRAEWFSTYSFTPFGPLHLVKLGAGVTYETFDGVSTNAPVRIVRANGTLSQEIAFAGGGQLGDSKTALQGYVQDAWTVAPQLTIQYGARYDYESLIGDFNVAPRGSFTLTVPADGRTVIRGGVGVFYNSMPLNVASFDQMQVRIVTRFADDGVTPAGAPTTLPNVVASSLRVPRSTNWNLEVDREWVRGLFVRVGYQQRQNRFDSIVDATESAILLRPDGRSDYREGQVSARYVFHGADQIVASYTRSSARGDLNDFNSFFANIENPIIRPDERGPLPWDAPNRVLIWGTISLPYEFTVSPAFDTRTGFPLSNVDADRVFVGPRNAVGRYPTFASLDAQVSKRFRVLGHNATLGLKVFNITDHFNPRDYQGNLASANFGGFDNAVGRTFRGKWILEF
jgi:hypothetical protein